MKISWLSSVLVAGVCACGPHEGGPTEIRESGVGEAQAAASTGHRAFRVMTYNVRGPLDTGVRAWPNRKAAVIERILANNADIVGVQEAQAPAGGPSVPADLIAGLTGSDKPYAVYNPGGGSPKLIFYKKSRFALAPEVGQGNEALVNPYASSAECHSHAEGKKISWVGLRDLTSGKAYFVANTHFAYSAICSLGRLKEAEQMATFLATRPAGVPVVAMGDFNVDAQSKSTPGETTIEDLESGARLFRTARFDGTTGVEDATFNNAWNGSTSTNYARLDYILHTGGELTSSAPAIDRTQSGGNTPSDHYPVLATIRPAFFSAGSTLSPTPSGTSADTQLFFADVTGDGCADRISWNAAAGEGETWVALSRCDGGFAPAVKNEGAVSVVSTTRFYFADVTGDGCADKVLWRPTLGDGEVRIYPSRCDGTFGERVSVTQAASKSESTRYFFADVTGDGCADLIRWNPTERGGAFVTYVARRGTTPSFGAAVQSSDGPNTSEGTRVYFADVDGDAKEDRIVWNPDQDGGRTRVYRSTGAGAFPFAFAHDAGTSGVDTSRFYFADLDGDGKADKIFWRPTFRQGRMQIYPSTGTNFAGSPVMDNTGFSGSENTRFFFAPIDGTPGADKVYWNPGAYEGDTKVFRAQEP
ncbi:FG-GAP-like repeat-containing protein [Melittangium boletus]|uniref:FG-GAP-like repeat-containing protein n=1 Tax=Melittangium boletus TaxID=83453 RepID=UPI003DA22E6F